jgi:hypothetical protein
LRIAFLTPEYVTESNFDGGLANYLHRVARGMKQHGHDVEIFTRSDQNDTISHDGILVNRVNRREVLEVFKGISRDSMPKDRNVNIRPGATCYLIAEKLRSQV